MTTTRTDRAQRLADAWRKYADMLSGCGADVAALAYLRSYADGNAFTAREVVDALADAHAALDILRAERAARQEESVTEDCHRCRHWTPAQRKWHYCIHCDGTGQVPAQQEENTR